MRPGAGAKNSGLAGWAGVCEHGRSMNARRIGVAIQTQQVHAEHQQLYRGVRDYSREHAGFRCILAPFAAADLKAAPKSRPPYDGILAQATPELVEVAAGAGVPVVDVWRDSRVTVPINCVFPDFAQAGRLVGQHLVSRGFERFGLVVNRNSMAQITMGDASLMGGDTLGFAAYVEARGFPCARFQAPRVVHADEEAWRDWSRAIRAWIVEQPRPLGLFVPNDMLCRHIADLAPELGLHVPRDLGLVCAENEPNYCLLSRPSLTAVDLGFRRVGYEAAALLDRMLAAGRRRTRREILLVDPHALYPRESTDAIAVEDPLVATALRYILEHAHEPIHVGDVARHAATTRRTLERRFREVLERTITQEIVRCRLDRLKRRLAESDTPIKILAADSGFNSPRALYETFVREEGLSPSAYRVRRRGERR